MRKLSQRKLDRLLTRHQNWLDGKTRQAKQLSLNGYDLTNIDFGGCILPKIKLLNCKLDDMSFRNGNFAGSQITGCSAKNTSWQGTILDKCDFSKSNCSHSNFKNARLQEAVFTSAVMEHCDLFGADIKQVRAECVRLHGSELSFANVSGADFSNSDLTKITARNLQAQRAVFTRADRSSSDFSYANMRECNCNEAIDNNLVMYKTDIRGSSYVKATVRDCLMPETLMDGNEFEGALFEGVVMYRDDGKNGFKKDSTAPAPVAKARTKPVTLKDFSIDDIFKELQRRMTQEQREQRAVAQSTAQTAAPEQRQSAPAQKRGARQGKDVLEMPKIPEIPSFYNKDEFEQFDSRGPARMAAGAEDMAFDEGAEIGDDE